MWQLKDVTYKEINLDNVKRKELGIASLISLEKLKQELQVVSSLKSVEYNRKYILPKSFDAGSIKKLKNFKKHCILFPLGRLIRCQNPRELFLAKVLIKRCIDNDLNLKVCSLASKETELFSVHEMVYFMECVFDIEESYALMLCEKEV